MAKMEIEVYEIAKDGLPDMEQLTGRVAFLFDGCVVSGWPLYPDHSSDKGEWEADSDVGHSRSFFGVTHWAKFPHPLIDVEYP